MQFPAMTSVNDPEAGVDDGVVTGELQMSRMKITMTGGVMMNSVMLISHPLSRNHIFRVPETTGQEELKT